MTQWVGFRLFVLLASFSLTCVAFAQGPAAGNSKLVIDESPLPPATPQHDYRFQFVAHGGIPPMKWEFLQGDMPTGIQLSADGVLSGTPKAVGEWQFTVSVTDTSKPPQTAAREIVLKIVEPLSLEWKNYPQVTGNQILGSVKVGNGTEDTFDFTLIVVAVNQTGKAFALGYQRFALKPRTSSFEIPFGQLQNLPQDQYTIHVDGVGEVEAKHSIYRRRLQTQSPLTIAVGP
jgi:Putative Ig domain